MTYDISPSWNLWRRRYINKQWTPWEEVDIDYFNDTFNPAIVSSVLNIMQNALIDTVTITYVSGVLTQFRRSQRPITQR